MVADARLAHERCLALGAWDVERRVQAMELHIPAIHGPGRSRFYFVDRWQEFSIFDIDFKCIHYFIYLCTLFAYKLYEGLLIV